MIIKYTARSGGWFNKQVRSSVRSYHNDSNCKGIGFRIIKQ